MLGRLQIARCFRWITITVIVLFWVWVLFVGFTPSFLGRPTYISYWERSDGVTENKQVEQTGQTKYKRMSGIRTDLLKENELIKIISRKERTQSTYNTEKDKVMTNYSDLLGNALYSATGSGGPIIIQTTTLQSVQNQSRLSNSAVPELENIKENLTVSSHLKDLRSVETTIFSNKASPLLGKSRVANQTVSVVEKVRESEISSMPLQDRTPDETINESPENVSSLNSSFNLVGLKSDDTTLSSTSVSQRTVPYVANPNILNITASFRNTGRHIVPSNVINHRLEAIKKGRPTLKVIQNLEEDVLFFRLKDLANEMPQEHINKSRLMMKLASSLMTPKNDECVIRIVKYCAHRCDHILGKDKEFLMRWQRFACPLAPYCVFETRFVGRINQSLMNQTDVLIFLSSLRDGLRLNELMSMRPQGQLWMIYSKESPFHDPEFAPAKGTKNPYNYTMTFFHDSDVYFPYCYKEKRQGPAPEIQKKSKLMIWLSSNCHLLSWRRGDLVREMKKHLPIDMFGKCTGRGRLDESLLESTLKQYKFYLAFENSECEDYITEKAGKRGLESGLVPIVYGSCREDYERIMPPNSFIYLPDFDSMQSFVDYIRELDADDERYAQFFEWRKDTEIACKAGNSFITYKPEVNLCYLIRKFVHAHAHPETSWQTRVPDFRAWWKGKCFAPDLNKTVLGFHIHEAGKRNHR